MSTTVLDAYSKAYPSITNRIRASVFLESDPLAPVATIIDNIAGHPARIWHFPGLTRANYGFSLDEIDGSGIVLANLALFDVVPGQVDGLLSRDDEQIKVDTTPGFDSGLQTVVFDGTGGKPNYIGWSIVPSELDGRGILKKGLDYNWDKDTGQFDLLQTGDVLETATYYNIHFDPNVGVPSDSVPTINDFKCRLITESLAIDLTDFGNTVIVEPSGDYIELYLPDISTVVQGRACTIETIKARGNGVQCVKIVPDGADTINFLRGNVFMMNNESLQIYRYKKLDLSNEWRIRFATGNFLTVGQSISDDAIQSGVYCKQLCDGSIKNRYKYARIYEEVVLTLPGTQVVDYDDWATGNNKYFFSKANSSNPANANKFYFPDRRNLYERNNNSGKAGDYQVDMIGPHRHFTVVPVSESGASNPTAADSIITQNDSGPGDFKYILKGKTTEPSVSRTSENTGTETRPKSYLNNKYVLI